MKIETEINELVLKAFEMQVQIGRGKILCPVCSVAERHEEQPMMPCGDFPDELFCPHCDLDITFEDNIFSDVALNERAYNDWTKHAVEMFLANLSNSEKK